MYAPSQQQAVNHDPPPHHQVLVDTNFINFSIKNKIDLVGCGISVNRGGSAHHILLRPVSVSPPLVRCEA